MGGPLIYHYLRLFMVVRDYSWLFMVFENPKFVLVVRDYLWHKIVPILATCKIKHSICLISLFWSKFSFADKYLLWQSLGICLNVRFRALRQEIMEALQEWRWLGMIIGIDFRFLILHHKKDAHHPCQETDETVQVLERENKPSYQVHTTLTKHKMN